MQKAKDMIVIEGEENPNSPSLYTGIKIFLNEIVKVPYKDYGKKEFSATLHEKSNVFKISGFYSDEFSGILYILKKGGNQRSQNKSVVDWLFYKIDSLDEIKNENVLFVLEENSTPPDRSGDQIEQRTGKFHRAIKLFKKAKFGLLIEAAKETVHRSRSGKLQKVPHNILELTEANTMSCRKLSTLGVQVYFSYLEEDTYHAPKFEKLSNQELINKCRNLRILDNGDLEIDINLSNGGNPNVCSDPMANNVISTMDIIREFGFDKTLYLKGHNLNPDKFKENNKLSCALRDCASYFNIYVENYDYVSKREPKSMDKIYYDEIDERTEKAGTIAFESFLRKIDPKQERYKILFTDHAGCGTTLVDTITELRELPVKRPYKIKPEATEIEDVIWLEHRIGKLDMLVLDIQRNILLGIEGESLSNMEKGERQIKSAMFQKSCEWFHQFFPTASFETHLITHGDALSKYILFSVDIEGNTSLNWNAKPISKMEPLT